MQRLQNQNRAGQAQSAPKRPPSAASSPTKSRPLPSAPGDAAKRATIDLGSVSGLPTPNNGSGFNFNGTPSSVSPSSSSTDGSGSGYFDSSTRKGNVAEEPTTPAKRFPQSSSSLQAGNSGHRAVSRTSSMAAGHNSNTTAMALSDLDSTPKRRASPPKFSGTSSNGSSPNKGGRLQGPIGAEAEVEGQRSARNQTRLRAPQTGLLRTSARRNPSKPSQAGSSAASTAGSSTPTSQQKFTPVWKRTIPDYPAPVFGLRRGYGRRALRQAQHRRERVGHAQQGRGRHAESKQGRAAAGADGEGAEEAGERGEEEGEGGGEAEEEDGQEGCSGACASTGTGSTAVVAWGRLDVAISARYAAALVRLFKGMGSSSISST
ncbi:hypothetical protein DFP72DRAFT_420347 [Ephemerocybe angulata]|uniref:Uncharacterized protein n=1 Tax=Ephemerocybe angulata TaxID=980116 RepID=A0A8H6IH31_9AGAR|nr:hypothetical protein DFP72DRAFT_420347 [Tulosesus angulatus]